MITIKKFLLLILAFTAISSHTIHLDPYYKLEFNNETDFYLIRPNREGNEERCRLTAIFCHQFYDLWRIVTVHFCSDNFTKEFIIGGESQDMERQELIEH
jgi:hypothetical protein